MYCTLIYEKSCTAGVIHMKFHHSSQFLSSNTKICHGQRAVIANFLRWPNHGQVLAAFGTQIFITDIDCVAADSHIIFVWANSLIPGVHEKQDKGISRQGGGTCRLCSLQSLSLVLIYFILSYFISYCHMSTCMHVIGGWYLGLGAG